jgi:hypothetical protein
MREIVLRFWERAKPYLTLGAAVAVFSAVDDHWSSVVSWSFGQWPEPWIGQYLATIPNTAAATIAACLVALVALWLSKRTLQRRLEPRLRIEGFNAPLYRVTAIIGPGKIEYFCRISVRNLSESEEIEGVTVRILHFDGDDAFDAPQTLNPKRQTINGGVSQNWTIAHGSHAALGEEVTLYINVEHRGEQFRTAAKELRLTIEASAAGVRKETKKFILRKDDNQQPKLIPIEEADRVEKAA